MSSILTITFYKHSWLLLVASLTILSACTAKTNETLEYPTPTTVAPVDNSDRQFTVGEIGSGGGTVFYVAPTPFVSLGSSCNTNCRYLEVAPAPIDGEPALPWATGENSEIVVPGDATALFVGTGMFNTNAIVAQTGNLAESSAAVYAHEYEHGGKSDWHLPSGDELLELYMAQDSVGGLVDGVYWSSSETVGVYAWLRIFENGLLYGIYKSEVSLVRPIRAF